MMACHVPDLRGRESRQIDAHMHDVRRILVIRGGAVGDFILTLPVLHALREHFPDARLDVMARPRVAELVVRRFYAADVIPIDSADAAPLYVSDGELPDSLAVKLRGYNLIVSFVPDADGVFEANLRRCCKGLIISAAPAVLGECEMHATERLAVALETLDIMPSSLAPKVYLRLEDEDAAARVWTYELGLSLDQRVLAVHPGSGGRLNCWAPERFAKVAERASTELDLAPLLIRGPADGEAVDAVLEAVAPLDVPVLENESLVIVASVLRRCAAYVGNDSGITHLAAAVGCPTVAVFGPTDPRIWGPRGRNVRIVHPAGPLPPETALDAVDAATVFDAVSAINS